MLNPIFTNDQVSSSRIIYTPSAFARSALIHLQETGSLTAVSPHTSARSGLVSYLFFVVHSGSGMLEYEGENYTLTAGDCVFIDCEKTYSHRSSQDLWSLSWIHFYGPNLKQIYSKYRQRGGGVVFRPDDISVYSDIIGTVQAAASSDSYIKDMEISESLSHLLTVVMKETVSDEPMGEQRETRSDKFDISRVKEYIDRNFSQKIVLSELAAEFYISHVHMLRLFKQQYGITVASYINQQRITKAKEMLRFTDSSIEAVAIDCGFEPNYFSRMFKKLEGMTPGEYRARW